nr:hypothetical protein [Tanacetum cinerariifolium]
MQPSCCCYAKRTMVWCWGTGCDVEGGCHGVAVVCRWPRWRGGDDGSGGARLETEGVVAARDGEWGGGSCRSGDGEGFWVRRKSFPAAAATE